ncbi:MAG: hypothetical protein WC824_13995 [Bacteroidota bacterium]|jgi:hypothetical protein
MEDLEDKWGSVLAAGERIPLGADFWKAHLAAASGIRKLSMAIREHPVLKAAWKVVDLQAHLLKALHDLEDNLDEKYST